MFGIKLIFILAFCILLDKVESLETLPRVEDNNIIKAESIIRSTLNILFSTLGLRKVKDKPKLKHFSVIHNYFVSLTLQDYNSLKEVAKLTRVKTSNSNETAEYENIINEVIDEGSGNAREDPTKYDIENDIKKIELLKKHYEQVNLKNVDLSKEVLNILTKAEEKAGKETTTEKAFDESNEQILDDIHNETWYEDVFAVSGRRIFKGKHAKVRWYPFMVSVHIFNKFQCGGSIIHSDLVITAASCLQLAWNNRFYRENPLYLSVRVGSSFFAGGGEVINVLEVYFHPSYSPTKLHSNLAVMRLVRHIKLGGRYVRKIVVDDLDTTLPLNVRVLMMGWGARQASNIVETPYQNKLRQARLAVYPLQECQAIYTPEFVTKFNFCAGSVSEGSGACNHDIGDPGVVNNKLVGVVSFGAAVCGTVDAPTVFTKLGYYHDWIEQIMEQNVPRVKKILTPEPYKVIYPPPSKPKSTNFNLLPVSTDNPHAYAINTEPVEPEESKINLRHYEKTLFKEFLKTMFNSAEVKDYLDTLDEKSMQTVLHNSLSAKHNKSLNSEISIENEQSFHHPSTQMLFVDPIPDEDKREKNKKKKITNKNLVKTTMLSMAVESDNSGEEDLENSLQTSPNQTKDKNDLKNEIVLRNKTIAPETDLENNNEQYENNTKKDEKLENVQFENYGNENDASENINLSELRNNSQPEDTKRDEILENVLYQNYENENDASENINLSELRNNSKPEGTKQDEKLENVLYQNENENDPSENIDLLELDNNSKPEDIRIGTEHSDYENDETLLLKTSESTKKYEKISSDRWENENTKQAKTSPYRAKEVKTMAFTRANIIKGGIGSMMTEKSPTIDSKLDEAILDLFYLSDNETSPNVTLNSESDIIGTTTTIEHTVDERELMPEIKMDVENRKHLPVMKYRANDEDEEFSDSELQSLWLAFKQELKKSFKYKVNEQQQEQLIVTPIPEEYTEMFTDFDLPYYPDIQPQLYRDRY